MRIAACSVRLVAGSPASAAVEPERPQLVAEEVEGHGACDCKRLRRQLRGRCDVYQEVQEEKVDAEPQDADREEARRLESRVALRGAKGPVAGPPEGISGP